MSRIDDLLHELAPAGVEFKLLGDVAEIASTRVAANQLDGGNYVGVDNLLPKFGGRKDSDYGASSGSAVRFQPGDILVGNIRPYLKKVWLADRSGGASPDVLTISLLPNWRERIIPRFLYFVIASEPFVTYSMQHAKGTKMPRGDKAATLKYRVPVPPRRVQEEIVRTLDHFTELDALLAKEFVVRRQQRLELARKMLETSSDASRTSAVTERVRLGEIATQFVETVRVQPDTTYVNLGVKWYGEGVFARESKLGREIKGSTLFNVRPGQLIFNRMFVTEGSFAIVTQALADGVVSNEFPAYELDESRVLAEWLLLYLLDEYSLKRIEGEVTGTERGSTKSRRRWKEQQFEAFEIDLPSIPEQRRVVRILSVIADLESTVRDERLARRKQLDYYRDKLLTFEEAAR